MSLDTTGSAHSLISSEPSLIVISNDLSLSTPLKSPSKCELKDIIKSLESQLESKDLDQSQQLAAQTKHSAYLYQNYQEVCDVLEPILTSKANDSLKSDISTINDSVPSGIKKEET